LWGERVPVKFRYPLPLPLQSPKAIGSRSCPPPLSPRSLLGHMTGTRRLRDHSQSAVILAHAQWVPGCEAASCHSRVPSLKMPAPDREDGR
ncbi:unnamed protein product, partial [Staurois parvus]